MQDAATWRAVSLKFRICMIAGIYSIALGYIYLVMSGDLNIKLLTISTAYIWKLSGVGKNRTTIRTRYLQTILSKVNFPRKGSN